MEETLKDLSGDLQMIHQSLERAEVVERQLGKYWREFAEERDHLRAENERLKSGDLGEAYNCGEQKIVDLLGAANAREKQLRAEVERLRANYEQFTTLCKATEERERTALNTVAGLRRALEEIRAAVTTSTGQCGVLGTNWAECDYCGAVSQERMTPIPHEKGCAFAVSTAALTATSDAHERRIKSEALKQAAEEVYNRLNAKGAHSGARRQGWEAGLVDFADYLKAEADRLEAANGR